MKLSIIVCIYNTKKEYFEDCLKSIFNENLSDFEVIVVDDGSTIDYSDIIKSLPIRYVKTENHGLLEARLFGIGLANGKYVSFVDSDDVVSLNYHQPMINAAESENADIVINNWAFLGASNCQYPTKDTTMSANIDISDESALLFYTSQRGREQSYFVQWNKLFKKELLVVTKTAIADSVKGKYITYAEDALMNFFNFKNAKRVINIHTGFYLYRIHSEQSVVAATESQLKKQIECMSFAFELMEKNCNGQVKDEALENIYAWRSLMSRAHYKTARLGKYTSLFPYIKEKYKVSALKKPIRSDVKAYSKSEALGKNFNDIDLALVTLYYECPTRIFYEKKCRYISRIVKYVYSVNTTSSNDSELFIPKRDISFRDRIIYNSAFYRIGLIFFKKGSKMRSFFKKLIIRGNK